MEALFTKLPNGTLMPASEQDRELLNKIKVGDTVRLKLTRPRNLQFHRKYMALLNLGFDYWEPPEADVPQHVKIALEGRGQQIEKNFDRFRKDIAILAGHYDASFRLNGECRLEAKSIAFANMTEDEFEKLYSATITVLLKHVMHNYTDATLREAVENMILEFA